ncbi:S41 family peptidase [Flavobacterium crassostreae]|uniref:Peptidase S41 n=1 Tax=Flavobacterium crassostreae TaxID=1763534 RepID=A0A1B9E0K0_9FLAO|nr:S41 family peptidase [Flavobacterium crassostreae]OCB75438.1 peptidase S41 [Flavobacterium crassostreae]
MHSYFKKKYLIPIAASAFLIVGTSFKNDFFEIAKQIEIFTTLFKELNTNYVDQTNPGELMDKAIKGMLSSLDPYTVYFNEQDVLKFKINNTGEYTGIGAIINRKEGTIIIREVFKGFPADKAGIQPGDEITKINDVLLSDFKADASELLKGGKNTKIAITYTRQGKTNTTEIILDEVEVKSVPFFAKIDATTGYIAIEHFNKKASNETRAALEALKKQGAERIVLDLRGNPGGLLNEAVAICNLFVAKDEIIVTTKSKIEKHNNTYKTTFDPVDTQIPLVILIDARSASASEIVSGALQDLDRAVVIGGRSYGKGLVQKPINLTYDTQLKVTISRYYTPSGRCIQALDYTHKDKNGAAIRTEEKNYNAFKTRNGRTVYDGGGILPDILLEDPGSKAILDALQKNDGIFNYATQYYHKHPNLGSKIPNITATDYQDFKQFLKSGKYAFDTQTIVALKNTLEVAKKEKIDATIKLEYDQLLQSIEKSQETLLDKNQEKIKSVLVEEILKRYQYQEGLYHYYLEHSPEIQKAVTLLKDPQAYAKILK